MQDVNYKTGEVLAQNAKNDTKNRSLNPKIGVAENRILGELTRQP